MLNYNEITLHGWVEYQAKCNPDKIAIICNDREISYANLNKNANQLVSHLRSKKVQNKSIIGVMMEPSIDYIISILAILKSGYAFLPINERFPKERIEYMLTDSSASLVLSHELLMDSISYAGEVIDISDLSIYNNGSESIEYQMDSTNLAYVMYTSGSTGSPKGVMIQHNSIVNQLVGLQSILNIDETDRHVLIAPISFDASVQHIFLALTTGATLFIVPEEIRTNPALLTDFLAEKEVNVMNIVPSFMNILLTNMDANRKLKFKRIMFAGEALTGKLYESVINCVDVEKVYNIYGPTEATINATYYECKLSDINHIIPIGVPISNYKVHVLDEQMQEVSRGGKGELYLSGIGIARGYLNKPELTRERFIVNPNHAEQVMYKTGDIVQLLDDDNLVFIGRADNQVKIGGVRIELEEIESLMLTHPKIREAVVLPREENSYTKRLCAYYIAVDDISTAELRSYISSKLPDPMIPSYFIKLSSIPLTVNGKVDKEKLISENQQQTRAIEHYKTPINDIEERLCIIWSSILGISLTRVNDNFYSLGGTSVDTIKLCSEIYKEFNVKLSLFEVFNSPTIQSLANMIDKSTKNKYEAISSVKKQEYYDLTDAQKRFWFIHHKSNLGSNVNMISTCMVEGEMKYQGIEKSVNILLEKHESLRTVFIQINGELKQKVEENVRIHIHYDDLCHSEKPMELAKMELKKQREQLFDLEKAPLLRIVILKVSNQKNVVAIIAHHIILDGFSRKLFLEELVQIYDSIHEGLEVHVEPMRLHFKDYVAWLNEQQRGDNLKRQEDYWLNHLKKPILELNLPKDYEKKGNHSRVPQKEEIVLDRYMSDSIFRMMQETNATLFMVLLASVFVFLHKYTNKNDIVVTTLISGRDHRDLDDILGFFVNTIALRLKLEPQLSFFDILTEVKKISISAYENQHYSFDMLKEKIEAHQDQNIFNSVFFNVEQIKYDDIQSRHFNIDPIQFDEEEVLNVDWSFEFIRDFDHTIRGVLTFDRNLFSGDTMRFVKSKYIEFLKSLLDSSRMPVSSLNMFESESKVSLSDFEFDFEF